MTTGSPLKGAIRGYKGILNGAVKGLNRAHMGQSYRADLGTNILSSLS